MREFLVIGNVARTDGDFSLDDIPGTSARLDVLARTATAAFLTSHGIRRDVRLHIVILGPPDPPKALRLIGGGLRHLNPDERSTAALFRRALRMPAREVWRESTPGLYVRRAGIEIAEELPVPLVLLSEEGAPLVDGDVRDAPAGGIRTADIAAATFVLGDHRGPTEEQVAYLRRLGAVEVSLGPVSLHTDHCVAVLHNRLDNARPDGARP